MPLSSFLASVVGWLRAGYPEGVPESDYVPLVAVLARRLSPDEVRSVAAELTRWPEVHWSALVANPRGAVRAVDSGVADLEYVVSASDGHSRATAGRSANARTVTLPPASRKSRSRAER